MANPRNAETPETALCSNLDRKDGHLCFAGQDTLSLAKAYGTPLYLMDEDRIRYNCRLYRETFEACLPAGSQILYASKAAAFKQMCRIVESEGLGLDAVSAGEIHTALTAAFPMDRVYYHGNNKTDEDVAFAMDAGVGCFVADGAEELLSIEAEAGRRGRKQKVLLRITPGIDPHTYAAVSTGQVDSKFGASIETGQADEFVALALRQPHLDVAGFHCHVGSQVFWEDVFERSVLVMMAFIRHIRDAFGYLPEELDLGGGYGVRYVESDPAIDIPAKIASVAEALTAIARRLDLPVPKILMEPGRSIVADAGLTLYTVGSVKEVRGYKRYVSIDGGMSDNPRYALYGSRYTCFNAGRMDEPADTVFDLVGRCCESGDVIQPNVPFPASTRRGDTVAVCTTGAYNFSMASGYNRLLRPPVVMLKNGTSYVAVKRETLEDITRLDQ